MIQSKIILTQCNSRGFGNHPVGFWSEQVKIILIQGPEPGHAIRQPAGEARISLPSSVLDTFPEDHLLSRHKQPAVLNKAATLLIWQKGAMSPKIDALIEILSG